MESVVESRAVSITQPGFRGTTLRILRVKTKTSEGTERASTMPARRLDLGFFSLSALFSKAEIAKPHQHYRVYGLWRLAEHGV